MQWQKKRAMGDDDWARLDAAWTGEASKAGKSKKRSAVFDEAALEADVFGGSAFGRGGDDDDEAAAAAAEGGASGPGGGGAAWTDEDDALAVDIRSASRLKKLRKTEKDRVIDGGELEARLRERFAAGGGAAWAVESLGCGSVRALDGDWGGCGGEDTALLAVADGDDAAAVAAAVAAAEVVARAVAVAAAVVVVAVVVATTIALIQAHSANTTSIVPIAVSISSVMVEPDAGATPKLPTSRLLTRILAAERSAIGINTVVCADQTINTTRRKPTIMPPSTDEVGATYLKNKLQLKNQ